MSHVHFALCAGLGIALCGSCARLAERHTPAQQRQAPGRISPTTDGHRCAAWRYATPSTGAVTPTARSTQR